MSAKAHEMRDSISLISYAGCLGLSPVIAAKIHSKCASQPEIAKNSIKPLFWGFKVVQSHRCWYPRKARQQCLQQVCVYLQLLVCYSSLARLFDSSVNRVLHKFDAVVRRTP